MELGKEYKVFIDDTTTDYFLNKLNKAWDRYVMGDLNQKLVRELWRPLQKPTNTESLIWLAQEEK